MGGLGVGDSEWGARQLNLMRSIASKMGSPAKEPEMLKIYLDTQDFAHLYKTNIATELKVVRDQLLEFRLKGQVSFPLSYLSLFEFVQDYKTEFEVDRQRRAEFLTQICGTDTLPFYLDIGLKGRPIDDKSWLPHGAIKGFSVGYLIAALKSEIKKSKTLNRNQRRQFQNSNNLIPYLRSFLNRQRHQNKNEIIWHPELPEFSFDFFRDFILGRLSEQEANQQFRDSVFEPAKFFSIWYQRFSNSNPLSQYSGKETDVFHASCIEFHRHISDLRRQHKDIRKTHKSLLKSVNELNKLLQENGLPSHEKPPKPQSFPTFDELITQQNILKSVDQLRSETATRMKAYFRALYDGQFAPTRSDIVDVFHAAYLEHVDLWRRDHKFCDFLLRIEGQPHNRIVSSLAELPARIEELLLKKG